MNRSFFRRIFTVCASAFAALPLFSQIPVSELSLGDLTFVRQSFDRNFYNDCKVMSRINMEGTDLFLNNAANLIVEADSEGALEQDGNTLVFKGAGKTFVRVGAFHPYLCYEVSFKAVPSGAV